MVQQTLVFKGIFNIEDSWSNSRHTKFGRTPLYEWSAWRRGLYLTTHNTHNG